MVSEREASKGSRRDTDMERSNRTPEGMMNGFPSLLDGLNISTSERPLETSFWTTEPSFQQPPYMSLPNRTNVSNSPLASPTRSMPRSQAPTPQRVTSGGQENSVTDSEIGSSASQFDPPSLRSIVASGQPTSSVSVNTAQASISTTSPGTVSRPFAGFTSAGAGVSTSSSRRRDMRPTEIANIAGIMPQNTDFTILETEKDIDDPMVSQKSGPSDSPMANTSQAVSSLFNTSSRTPPGQLSRESTYGRRLSNTGMLHNDTSTVTGHLLQLGFEEGRHSDITIRAFGKDYRLHKLMLERVPYFSSAFCGPWEESSAKEMTLLPEDIDSNITQTAFELAMRRIYGTIIPYQEEQEAVGLFATGCWLDMPDLVESCIEHILRQMQLSTLHVIIKIVTNNYYGKAGDRILSSAKAMLCRDGWEMPYEFWDGIPADIIREIIGGDPFYTPSEWERWYLALKLLNRRLRRLATEAGLVSVSGKYLCTQPSRLRSTTIRPGNTPRTKRHTKPESAEDQAWRALYSHPEVAPILTLLDEGIHYVHLQFEQLQIIRSQRDILGIPVLPDKVISDALWMSMEIRQRVLKAQDGDVELGLSEPADTEEDEEDEDDDDANDEEESTTPLARPRGGKGKQREHSQESMAMDSDFRSPVTSPGPRKFWIPSNDVSCVMGGSREAYTSASFASPTEAPASASNSTHLQRSAATPDVTDSAWAADLGSSLFDSAFPVARNFVTQSRPRYSEYPPFRFCAEFPHPRTLKDRKRVYSQTVWYAGSLWNLYIQKFNTPKNQQLGIWLHRAKDKDPSDDPLALTVDDRIGQLEREMLMRRGERRSKHWRVDSSADLAEHEQDDAQSSSNDHDPVHSSQGSRASALRPQKTSQSPAEPRSSSQSQAPAQSLSNDTLPLTDSSLDLSFRHSSAVSTIPPYTDARTTIKTYFKIYSPSKGGRLLSVYESAPDSFHFGKSWGWKSSCMVLDDGFEGRDLTRNNPMAGDGRLRYMVVMGNV